MASTEPLTSRKPNPGFQTFFPSGRLGPLVQSADDWLSDLDWVCEKNRKRRQLRLVFTGLSILAFLLFGGLLFLVAGIWTQPDPFPKPDHPDASVAVVAGLLVVVFMAFAALLSARKAQRPLEGFARLSDLLIPLITILKEDVTAGEPMELVLDMGPAAANSKQVVAPDAAPQIPNSTTTYFVSPWLKLKARFADGSIINCQMVDHVRRRKITKRSSSGKVKYKTKDKVTIVMKVQLGLPLSTYRVAPEAASLQAARVKEVAPEASRQPVVVVRQMTVERLGTGPSLDEVLHGIASAYRSVSPNSEPA
jgi:hypothetical protein